MKSHAWLLVAALAMLVGAVPDRASADILWGSATQISGDSDVSNADNSPWNVLAYAYSFAEFDSPTVNDVTFQAANPSAQNLNGDVTLGSGNTDGALWGNNETAFGSPSAPYSGLSSEYQTLLQGAGFAGGGLLDTFDVTLNNLVEDQLYFVQAWVNDSRGSVGPSRSQLIDDLNTVNLEFNTGGEGGLGEYIIGTFVATGTSETFQLANTGLHPVQLNALQVRTVPEPSAFLALSSCCAGLVIRRRRRRVIA